MTWKNTTTQGRYNGYRRQISPGDRTASMPNPCQRWWRTWFGLIRWGNKTVSDMQGLRRFAHREDSLMCPRHIHHFLSWCPNNRVSVPAWDWIGIALRGCVVLAYLCLWLNPSCDVAVMEITTFNNDGMMSKTKGKSEANSSDWWASRILLTVPLTADHEYLLMRLTSHTHSPVVVTGTGEGDWWPLMRLMSHDALSPESRSDNSIANMRRFRLRLYSGLVQRVRVDDWE